MFSEDELLPISALQHLAFCERQWALIHIEGIWRENRLTVEGRHLHDRAHGQETESRGDLHIARGLRLRSFRLGLAGIADVVEFEQCPETFPGSAGLPDDTSEAGGQSVPFQAGVILPDVSGTWRPTPVEYKRGRPKLGPYDEIQLCAQALCLEEMLGTIISSGALYYGQPRRRHKVDLTQLLREQTVKLAARLHELTRVGKTPPARYEKKCESCSLLELCMPKALGASRSVRKYLDAAVVGISEV